MAQYIIQVIEDGQEKYLFNTRVLLEDPALAKPFSEVSLARRYFNQTIFLHCAHRIMPMISLENL